jgi:predicted transcriptional regulator
MEEDVYVKSLKFSLWNLLAGTRGGFTRIQIIKLLRKRPYNINQLKDKLSLDYKTVQHHIRFLMDSNIITTGEKRYGSMYFLSPLLEKNMGLFEEILDKVGENKINKGKKNHR